MQKVSDLHKFVTRNLIRSCTRLIDKRSSSAVSGPSRGRDAGALTLVLSEKDVEFAPSCVTLVLTITSLSLMLVIH